MDPKIKVFEVGGHVRDRFLGIESKDVDCAVEAPSFDAMLKFVEASTNKIFQIKEEFLTIRAMGFDGQPKDFVLCRKEGAYSDARHPDFVEVGTIFDDLNRRDCTINAMAIDVETGKLIDPHNGLKDLNDRIIRCVGTAEDRFNEDTLRLLRVIRFAITKEFFVDDEIKKCFSQESWAQKLSSVSTDRVREEMLKCFKHNTVKTMKFLHEELHTSIVDVIFKDIWLKPTTEKF